MSAAGSVRKTIDTDLLEMGSATLYEASGLDCYLDADFRPVWDGARIVGRALPVLAAAGDNLPLHWAIDMAQEGDVLVVDAGGDRSGFFGEVMAAAAIARGVAGIVIDGGVRDTLQLRDLGFPAFSTHIAIRGTHKRWAGTVGSDVTLRGRVVAAGDTVVADRDGIAIIPHSETERVASAARHRVAVEGDYLRRLSAGESTLDIYNFRHLGRPAVGGGLAFDNEEGQ